LSADIEKTNESSLLFIYDFHLNTSNSLNQIPSFVRGKKNQKVHKRKNFENVGDE